jgi:ATP-binding cassette subfamily B protein
MRLRMDKRREESKQSISWGTLRRIIGYITPYWQLKAVMALIVLTTVLDVLTPAVIGSIIDMVKDFSSGNPIQHPTGVGGIAFGILNPIAVWVSKVSGYEPSRAMLLVFSLSLVFIAVSTGASNYLQRYASSIISQKGSFDLRQGMYNSLLDQSFSFYDKQRTGQLMARATGDINMLERFFNFGLRMLVSSVLISLMVVYSLVSINSELTLGSMVIIPFVVLVTRSFARRIRPRWDAIREQNGVITSVLQENLSGVRVVRGFSREDYEEVKFLRETGKYFNLNVDMARDRALFMPLASFISSLGFVIIIWYGGNQVISGVLSLGSMVAFYFYLARLMSPIRHIGLMTSMLVRANTAAERVFGVIDAEVEVHDSRDAGELKAVKGRITFDNVWFSYDGGKMVLCNIDLDVRPGQTVAILGATGSGKSSIINLIPRFYDVTEGSIRIDGVDVRDVTIKSLREHVGIVRQDPFIFSTTLRENIAFDVKDARFEDVREAARRARIHEFIESLPDGYETKVGERGVTLSGGQKQRVAIARALFRNPKILILDDSTSSVDTQTEYEIQQALDELLTDRTTFIITQRLSSIKKADYIVVMEDGRIADEGVHEELMEKKGIYWRLYTTQIPESEEGRRV